MLDWKFNGIVSLPCKGQFSIYMSTVSSSLTTVYNITYIGHNEHLFDFFLFVWSLLFHSRIFHSYGDHNENTHQTNSHYN